MAKYKIEVKKSAIKELESIPKNDLKRILAKIKLLAENPRQSGSIKLSGDDRYRIRQGGYRILYTTEDDILTIYIVKLDIAKMSIIKQLSMLAREKSFS